MVCRCPACHASFEIPPDQIDFLVRCDACRCMFIARSPDAIKFARKVAADIQADATGTGAPASSQATPEEAEAPDEEEAVLSEVAQLAQQNQLAEARARHQRSFRQKKLERFHLRWRRHAMSIISLFGLGAVVLLSGLVFILHTLRPASVANASTLSTPPAAKSPDSAAPAEKASAPTGTGELYPDIKSQ